MQCMLLVANSHSNVLWVTDSISTEFAFRPSQNSKIKLGTESKKNSVHSVIDHAEGLY